MRRPGRGARFRACARSWLAVLLLAGASACGASVEATASADEAPAGAGGSTTHQIAIRGFAFEPPSLRVAPGDTVVWTNADLVPHTATATGGAWDSGSLEDGASWRWVAGHAGTYEYLCSFHPGMQGTLVIQ
jgi:plastocyanin